MKKSLIIYYVLKVPVHFVKIRRVAHVPGKQYNHLFSSDLTCDLPSSTSKKKSNFERDLQSYLPVLRYISLLLMTGHRKFLEKTVFLNDSLYQDHQLRVHVYFLSKSKARHQPSLPQLVISNSISHRSIRFEK